MIEICTISMPSDATQLRLYVAACEDLSPIHHLYKNHCQLTNDIDSLKSNMRAGMSEEIFRELASSTKNRKRPCPFTVNQQLMDINHMILSMLPSGLYGLINQLMKTWKMKSHA